MGTTVNVGIDVGSTTVKAVVMSPRGEILWKDYQRHNTRQAAKVREFLDTISAQFKDCDLLLFLTGSGGRAIAPHVQATYVQEVNAVTYAVEQMVPDAGSVIELGGQDAKVIIWKVDEQGRKSTLTFMNDKCAGGTGATLDKIFAKIGISSAEAGHVRAEGKTVHHVAAKCGVFAETDVVGLLKNGIDREEIVVSLCTAIARQNLEVLVRGNVLRDRILLLGGPHTYLPVFSSIWRTQIPATWDLHGWSPSETDLEKLIYVPEDAQYFAAIGAVQFGLESRKLGEGIGAHELATHHPYAGPEKLDHFIGEGRMAQMLASGAVRDGLVSSSKELEAFTAAYAIAPFVPPELKSGSRLDCYIGIDGGSTSSKLVILDSDGELIYSDYLLSRGNPIADVQAMFVRMLAWEREHDVTLEVKGTAVTGYASGILAKGFSLDTAVVETVAHMKSAVRSYGDIDVICDVGGQDIKVMFLKHGRVVDFKLNTQCSAGNGYFLQAMAEQFGIPIEEYASHAFRAHKAPAFNYGCAVFMEQDRVNFQQLGWTNDEIMAGLALVLPLNIWNYVVQEPHVARFGTRFVLQGGTQKNLAAVKSQVDYIKAKIPKAQVHVHAHADICGAIGAALEARDSMQGKASTFVGIERGAGVTFTSRNNETTRCRFCTNRCNRTFIDIVVAGREPVRFISGYSCEKGAADSAEQMKNDESVRRSTRVQYPNLVDESRRAVFGEFPFEPLPHDGARIGPIILQGDSIAPGRRGPFRRSSEQVAQARAAMVVGMPRLLNLFMYAPFFSTYLRTLGVGAIRWSPYTSAKLWDAGNKWGAIDPCFPAKVAPAHIWNLITTPGITHICFPMITHLESHVENTLGNNACVIQMGTPEVTEAVFTRDHDHFTERGIAYWKPLVRMDRPVEAQGLLFNYFGERLGITADENAWAVRQGFAAMAAYLNRLRNRGRAIINTLIDTDRIGILVLGHPYHHDPGLNHGILDRFQERGFPILSIESLPVDDEFLRPLFDNDEDRDSLQHESDIKDVWQRNFNRNTNLKIWAAKVAARHPNLAVIDFSSFKCGHDAPTYSYIDHILDASKTPHFLFHDVDQNKPSASIKIRIQTIEYFLRLEEERLKERVDSAVIV